MIDSEIQADPILQVACDEPEGRVIRSVIPVQLSLEKLKFLWNKLKGFDTLFNDFVRGDQGAFISHFVTKVDGEFEATGLMWSVDDVGMFFMNDIKPCESASGHFTFWDRRFKGREELCREMIRYVMNRYQLVRIEVMVPLHSFFTLDAMERIGLIKEGRKRKVVLYKGNWFDVNIYSVVQGDEILKVKEEEAS